MGQWNQIQLLTSVIEPRWSLSPFTLSSRPAAPRKPILREDYLPLLHGTRHAEGLSFPWLTLRPVRMAMQQAVRFFQPMREHERLIGEQRHGGTIRDELALVQD